MWFPEVWQIIPIKNKNYLQSLWIGIVMPIIWLPKSLFVCLIYPVAKALLGGLWILARTYSILPVMAITGYASGIDREFPQPVIRQMSLEELKEFVNSMEEKK